MKKFIHYSKDCKKRGGQTYHIRNYGAMSHKEEIKEMLTEANRLVKKDNEVFHQGKNPVMLEMGAYPDTPEWASRKLDLIYHDFSEDEIEKENLVPEWREKMKIIKEKMEEEK